ncbi:prephenate dehydrogenase [Rosistilla ulvae]|uniref:Prephenate dehydrogenase n=1 Tax=Rosistilla ulvae TaxID=1930277 RepID=A0A517M6W8_9BACT|nr:prephenate dehydrogenase/arogenate dehydrogenase family protein [Rosistilla ulvae]QDS90606.1 prephenate dehydrogenase [Rosistilla ulvae]
MNREAQEAWRPRRIAVIGVGLLGGSVALAAKRRWPDATLVGSSRKPETRQTMLDLQVVDHAFADAIQCVADCDLIIIAAPVGHIARLLPEIADASDHGAIITDVGSTKQEIVAAAEAHPAAALRFVGSHPIAGSERTGVENASVDLFQGKLSITTPTDQTDPIRHDRVKQFWREIGCRVISMSPADHDLALASASHMPHIASAALALALPQKFAHLTGSGFRDATRIAAGDPLMWRQIVEANAPAVLAQLQQYESAIGQFRGAIASQDWAGIEKLFADAQTAKQTIDAATCGPEDDSE